MGGSGSLLDTICCLCTPTEESILGKRLSEQKKALEEGSGNCFVYGVSSSRGWRRTMEDAHISMPNFAPNIGFFAVLDGHGGRGFALLAAQLLPDMLLSQRSFSSNPPNYKEALTQSFIDVDAYLRSEPGGLEALRLDHERPPEEYEVLEQQLITGDTDGSHPINIMGCTCVAALVFRDKIIVANVGDSRCVLSARRADSKVICRPLSSDHKPSNDHELRRIINAGGSIQRDILGGFRINGGLNVSRGFGDFAYKDPSRKPKDCMVSVIPDIQEYGFSDMEQVCLILCCDGIWERHTNDAAVDFVQTKLQETSEKHRGTPHHLTDIASQLIDRSTCTLEEKYSFEPHLRFTGQDNMTVVLVRILESAMGRAPRG